MREALSKNLRRSQFLISKHLDKLNRFFKPAQCRNNFVPQDLESDLKTDLAFSFSQVVCIQFQLTFAYSTFLIEF